MGLKMVIDNQQIFIEADYNINHLVTDCAVSAEKCSYRGSNVWTERGKVPTDS